MTRSRSSATYLAPSPGKKRVRSHALNRGKKRA